MSNLPIRQTQGKQSNQKGFTLFMAMVITATLLLIAGGVANLAIRQSLISNAGKESQMAFYAADTGMECALYWDINNPSGSSAFSVSTGSNIVCNDQTVTVGGSSVSTFGPINFAPDPYCVFVTVEKNGTATEIESRGYNTCDLSSPRRVERAVRASY